jgi:hypothetical protein
LRGILASGTGSLGRSLDSGIGSLADCIYAVWRGQGRSVQISGQISGEVSPSLLALRELVPLLSCCKKT